AYPRRPPGLRVSQQPIVLHSLNGADVLPTSVSTYGGYNARQELLCFQSSAAKRIPCACASMPLLAPKSHTGPMESEIPAEGKTSYYKQDSTSGRWGSG